MNLNIAVAVVTLSASTVKAWPANTPGEVVKPASSDLPALYYLGKGEADPMTEFAQPPSIADTEEKCVAACETGNGYSGSFEDGLWAEVNEEAWNVTDLESVDFFSDGSGHTECWCGIWGPVYAKRYTPDVNGAGQCTTWLHHVAGDTSAQDDYDVSCDNWKTFCYGCLEDSVNGGELAPSNQPSSLLSSQPSVSGKPSQSPSDQPSSQPSSQPSGKPSQSPSNQPSSQPSGKPSQSLSPSCTPSKAPTPSPSVNLFYPDQTQNGFESGCLNDGQQPAWMDANPTAWFYSTLEKCCKQHFNWNYNYCMGNLDNACARALWYPDWEGTNKGCVHDGNEPLYMTANKIYLFNTKADCCEEHYSYDIGTCMGGAAGGSSGSKWYADWTSGDDTCKNDGKAPEYMTAAAVNWLYDDQEDCCIRFFSYALKDCMGTIASSAGTGKYFPDWEGENVGCRVDNGSTLAPEYMHNSGHWLYDTLDTCCEKHYGYNLSGCKGQSTVDYTGSEKWYIEWSTGKCVQDCTTQSGTKCGGLADSWNLKYDTQEKCCAERSWWDKKECMA